MHNNQHVSQVRKGAYKESSVQKTPAWQDSARATTEPRVQPTIKRKSASAEPRPKRTRRSAKQDVQRLADVGGEHAPLTQADIPGIVQAVLANLPGRSTPPPDAPDYAPQHDLGK